MRLLSMLAWLSVFLFTACSPGGVVANRTTGNAQTLSIAGQAPLLHNREASPLAEGSRNGVQVSEGPGEGLVYLPDVEFSNGTLEFDVRGRDVAQRSFVGIAFHGADAETYDAVYFRPFNFRAADPSRRSHSVQYISHPDFTWSRLREENPGKYEAEIPSPPDPAGWLHARVVIDYPQVNVFLGGSDEPCLTVEQLSDRKEGWVGFWVGNGSNGDFANLEISPAE